MRVEADFAILPRATPDGAADADPPSAGKGDFGEGLRACAFPRLASGFEALWRPLAAWSVPLAAGEGGVGLSVQVPSAAPWAAVVLSDNEI